MDRRSKLLGRLDRAWSGFRESYAGLSQEELLMPGVAGEWSVRDVIAHVTTWEQEALKYLPLLLHGGRPPRYSVQYGGIDAFNELKTEEKKDIALLEVLRHQNEVHQQLINFLEIVPEDNLLSTTRFCRRLRADTYGHYARHASAIRRWRNHFD